MTIKWLAAALLLLIGTIAQAYVLNGKVDRVSDGDTFLLITAEGVPHKVRMLYIDSPERGRPFYKRAKQMLAGIIEKKTVKADCTWLDSFNRHLCVVFLGEESINRTMIARGGAWLHPKYYDAAKDPAKLVPVQEQAQREKVGLWGITEYKDEEPWNR